jgi:hypothetical protein
LVNPSPADGPFSGGRITGESPPARLLHAGGRWTAPINCNIPETDHEEAWLFNDAPRWLRIIGIEHVPDLIEELVGEANKTAEQIKAKVTNAKELATAIHEIATVPKRK